MCMGYRIPADTTVNMLVYATTLGGASSWYRINVQQTCGLDHGKCGFLYGASWNVGLTGSADPLVQDDSWHHKCINLDAQLDEVLGPAKHTIKSLIWHGNSVQGSFWIDDFAISKKSRTVDRGLPQDPKLLVDELFVTRQPPTNAAAGKPTAQSSTGHGGVASRAVDGDTRTSWGSGSCTHTNGGASWWRVDLEKEYVVRSVGLWNRGDCCGDRLKDYEIWVGDEYNTAKENITRCGDEQTTQVEQGGSRNHVCNSIRGRYVTVTRNNMLTLCEVQVGVEQVGDVSYNVTLKQHQCKSVASAPSVDASNLLARASTTVQVTATQVQAGLSLQDKYGDLVMSFKGNAANVSHLASTAEIAAALFPITGKVSVERSGSCHNYDLDIKWLDSGGDRNAALNASSSGKHYVALTEVVETGGVLYTPIPGTMLHLPAQRPEVVVRANGLPAACEGNCSFHFVPSPMNVTSVTPSTGIMGSTITIAGAGFAAGTEVNIGGSSCVIQSVTDTQIVVQIGLGQSSPTAAVLVGDSEQGLAGHSGLQSEVQARIPVIGCSASSVHSAPYECQLALDNIHSSNSWATKGEGVGSWVQAQFGKGILLHAFEYQNRGENEANQNVTLSFDDGTNQSFVLAQTGLHKYFLSSPVLTTNATLTVNSVYKKGDYQATLMLFPSANPRP